MEPLPRRAFLGGAAAASVTLLPRSADAAPAIEARVGALRAQWACQREDYLASMFADRPAAGSNTLTPHAEALGDGLGGLATLKDLEEVGIEDQIHPAFQELIGDAATAIGGALVSCRELLEEYLDGDGDDPDRETHLRAALRSVRLGLGEWKTTTGRQRALEEGLLEVERETTPGALLHKVRRQLQRLRRVEALAAEMQTRWGRTGVLEVQSPEVLARVEAGRERWNREPGVAPRYTTLTEAEDGPPLPGDCATRGRRPELLVFGIVVMGLGIVGGGMLVLSGACSVGCGGGAPAVLVLLAGLAVIGLAVWAGVVLIGKSRPGREEERIVTTPTQEPIGPLVSGPIQAMTVLAGEGWMDAPVGRTAGRVVQFEAHGMARGPRGWAADADGNGAVAGADALLPGAPICALVGRVGEDRFFLGSAGVVPAGAPGPLQVAINTGGDPTRPVKGSFAVWFTILEPAGSG